MPDPKILVVDDEPAVRSMMQRLLQANGYQVWTAESASQAEPLLETHEPDIIICDYVMPEENGLAFLSRLRDSHPHLIRVLLTGFADTRTALSAINDAHVHYFVVKPFDAEELLQTLADLLAAFPRPQAQRPKSVPDLDALARLRQAHPGIDAVRRNTQGYIILEEEETLDSRLTDQYEAVLDLSAAAPVEAPEPPEPHATPPAKTPQREPTVLRNLKAEFPDIAEVRRTRHGHILIDEEEMAALLEMDESILGQGSQTRDEQADKAPLDRPGSDPLTEWDDMESHETRRDARTPKRTESEIVFDDSLLKLIGS